LINKPFPKNGVVLAGWYKTDSSPVKTALLPVQFFFRKAERYFCLKLKIQFTCLCLKIILKPHSEV
jgi:hypothetical protein